MITAMIMPMVASRFPAQAVYDQAAERLGQELDAGRDVAVLCEGDPLFYGSFMYLFGRLADKARIEVVPGVSSLTACAAAAGFGLAARNDRMVVLTGPMEEEKLRLGLGSCDSAVIMKVGRSFAKLHGLLAEQDLLECATYVERASLPNQKVIPLASLNRDFEAPYFSMILLHKRGTAWSMDGS